METREIILSALAFLFGGGSLKVYLDYSLKNRKMKSSELEKANEMLRNDNIQLKKEFADFESKMERVNKLLIIITSQASVNEDFNNLPFPKWVTDYNNDIIYFNNHLIKTLSEKYQLKHTDYLSDKENKLFGSKVGNLLDYGNNIVLEDNKIFYYISKMTIDNQELEGEQLIIKYPYSLSKTTSGVVTIMIPFSDIKTKAKKYETNYTKQL